MYIFFVLKVCESRNATSVHVSPNVLFLSSYVLFLSSYYFIVELPRSKSRSVRHTEE